MREDVSELYRRYRRYRLQARPRSGGKMIFHGVDGFDVYNSTAPFHVAGRWYLAARVEMRDSERSRVLFFAWDGGHHATLQPDLPEFILQDPFVAEIDGRLLFGGVEVEYAPDRVPLRWRTRFYIGHTVSTLRLLATGPWGMKDIRLVSLPDGRILVFTRSQGEVGGRGTIGWVIISSLNELNASTISRARLIPHLDEQYWCGVNSAYCRSEGDVEVLAHVARFDEMGNRHYYAARFIFDYHRGTSSAMEIIACREDFLPGECKREDLRDVVFPAGLLETEQGGRRLFCGTSDCEIQWLDIPSPFGDRWQ